MGSNFLLAAAELIVRALQESASFVIECGRGEGRRRRPRKPPRKRPPRRRRPRR